MKRKLFLSLSALALVGTGCAYMHSTTESSTDPKTKIVTVETKVRAYTLFDSQSGLTKFRNAGETTRSNEWASGTTIGQLSQSASSTNVSADIGTIIGAALKAYIGK